MADKRILTIQDISCVGQCSMTVALPILSACGMETCILPSAVLSTHTGGFQGYTFRDLTDDFPAIHRHWQKEGLTFDAVYTGYLGSVRQIAYVEDILSTMLTPEGKVIVDPAMADNGKLYAGFDDSYVEAMRGLCGKADVILPNITEACMMTGAPYQESYDEAYVQRLMEALTAVCPGKIVLTGVSYCPQDSGVAVYQEGHVSYYRHRRVPRSFHGTGDIYASTFTGAWLRGNKVMEAAQIAADYTLRCIEGMEGREGHWYGVRFENELPYLIKRLEGVQ